MAVSHPELPTYGMHYTPADFFFLAMKPSLLSVAGSSIQDFPQVVYVSLQTKSDFQLMRPPLKWKSFSMLNIMFYNHP